MEPCAPNSTHTVLHTPSSVSQRYWVLLGDDAPPRSTGQVEMLVCYAVMHTAETLDFRHQRAANITYTKHLH